MTTTIAKAAKRHTRSQKTYRMKRQIPKTMKESAGRTILEVIARMKGKATGNDIRKALIKKAPRSSDATLRFYLGKFQREGIVGSKEL